jgi:HTH domain
MSRSRIEAAPQRQVYCRLALDIMRTIHETYAPHGEPFGPRLESFFIAICVVVGDIEKKPFSATKIAEYMNVPRTTVVRRLDQLEGWGLIKRHGRSYISEEKVLNSVMGMRSYKRIRHLIDKAVDDMVGLDAKNLSICRSF